MMHPRIVHSGARKKKYEIEALVDLTLNWKTAMIYIERQQQSTMINVAVAVAVAVAAVD